MSGNRCAGAAEPLDGNLLSGDIEGGFRVPSESRADARAAAIVPSSRGTTAYQAGRLRAASQFTASRVPSITRHSFAISGLKDAINASSGFPRLRGVFAAAFQEASAFAGCAKRVPSNSFKTAVAC